MSKTINAQTLKLIIGSILCLATIGVILSTVTGTNARPAKQVGPWDAMKAATNKVPGSKAFSATYAKEGDKWLYDVIVINGKKITEVEVDAETGKVGATEEATPEDEGKEMTEELSKAIGVPASAKETEEKDEKGEKPEQGAKSVR